MKEILKQFGESTAYSAKCHFKSADVRRRTAFWMILINIVISVITLTALVPNNEVIQALSAISLIASILLLYLESRDGQNNVELHMKFGNLYLELHNDISITYRKPNVTEIEIENIKNRMNEINKMQRPVIFSYAKKLAKKAIEEKGEMITWWK